MRFGTRSIAFILCLMFFIPFSFIFPANYLSAQTPEEMREKIDSLEKAVAEKEKEVNDVRQILGLKEDESTQEAIEELTKDNNTFVETIGDAVTKHSVVQTTIIVVTTLVIILMTWWLIRIADNRSRDLVDKSEDKDEMIKSVFDLTLGLPQGSIRGILSLIVILFFVGFAFYKPEHFIEPVKIITTTIIAFYFAKKGTETKAKDILNAVTGKSTQKNELKVKAQYVIKEAEMEGAAKYANDLLERAKHEKSKGDDTTNVSDAVSCYKKAIDNAIDAKSKAMAETRENALKELEALKQQNSSLTLKLKERLDDINELNIQNDLLEDDLKAAEEEAKKENFEKANQILEKMERTANALMQEFDEAKDFYENKLSEVNRNIIDTAPAELDAKLKKEPEVILDGSQLTETMISTMNSVKEHAPNLKAVYAKRLGDSDITKGDIAGLVKDLGFDKESKVDKIDLKDIKTNMVISALEAADISTENEMVLGILNNATDLFTKKRKDIKKESLAIINSSLPDGIDIDEDQIDDVVQNLRKNVVDDFVDDYVRKALPEGITFKNFQKTLGKTHEIFKDKDSDPILKIINVAEEVLSYTPIAAPAKFASAFAKGIYGFFKKKKK